MSAVEKILNANALSLIAAAFGFLQTAIIVRHIGLDSLGYVLVIHAWVALASIAWELMSSQRLAKTTQNDPRQRTVAYQILLITWISLTLALIASHAVTVEIPLTLFFFAALSIPGQYIVNVDSIICGRPDLPIKATLMSNFFRVGLLLIYIQSHFESTVWFYYLYFLPPTAVYSFYLINGTITLNDKFRIFPTRDAASALIHNCRSTNIYVLCIGSKKLRESSLAILFHIGVMTTQSVALLAISMKGTDFIISQIRIIENTFRNERYYREQLWDSKLLLKVGFASFLLACAVSASYIALVGLAPTSSYLPYLYALVTVPIAMGTTAQAMIFHQQNFTSQLFIHLTTACLLIVTALVFEFFLADPNLGFIVGALLGACLAIAIANSSRQQH